MGVIKNRVLNVILQTLNSVLVPLNSVLAPMIGAKMGCYFNNSMFLIKKYN